MSILLQQAGIDVPWWRSDYLPEYLPENDVSTLEHAIALAALAHAGQAGRQRGVPYILHPLRVILDLEGAEERIVAVLHDVVEDCG